MNDLQIHVDWPTIFPNSIIWSTYHHYWSKLMVALDAPQYNAHNLNVLQMNAPFPVCCSWRHESNQRKNVNYVNSIKISRATVGLRVSQKKNKNCRYSLLTCMSSDPVTTQFFLAINLAHLTGKSHTWINKTTFKTNTDFRFATTFGICFFSSLIWIKFEWFDTYLKIFE